jgi:group I intron endonuclease
MIVYKVTNIINNKIYIGVSKFDIDKRKWEHLNKSDNSSDFVFHKAIRKYGVENFNWEVIDEASSVEELKQKEIFYIKDYNSFYKTGHGYNMTHGGDLNNHLKGEASPVSKLTEEEVLEIHKLLKNTYLTYPEIALKLNIPVGEHQIYYINYGMHWNIDGVKYPIRNDARAKTKMGSNNPQSKLNDKVVLQIIDKLINTSQSQTSMAKDYGVHYNTINEINRCIIWTHLHKYKKNIRNGI